MQRVLGIDLGLGCTGLVSIAGKKIVSEVIGITDKKCTKEKKIIAYIKGFISEEVTHKELVFPNVIRLADLIVIEKPFNIMGHGKMLVELFGIVKFFVIKYGVPYTLVSQMTLKKFATGSGKAQKSDMVMQAFKEFKFEAKTEDEVDAFWLAKMGECKLHGRGFTRARIESVRKLEVVNYEFK